MKGSAAVAVGVLLAVFGGLAGGCSAPPVAASPQEVSYGELGEIALGKPDVDPDGTVRIPFTIESGEWNRDAEIRFLTVQQRRSVYVTALRTPAPDSLTASTFAVLIGKQRPGPYRFHYLDPDGTAHFVGEVTIPRRRSGS